METEITEKERKAIEEAAVEFELENGEKLFFSAEQNGGSRLCIESFKAGAEFALTELQKPSEPETGRTDEELVQKIADLIESDLLDSYAPGFYQDEDNTDSLQLVDLLSSGDTIESGRENIHMLVDGMNCIQEIAKLLPSSRCQKNDVNRDVFEKLQNEYLENGINYSVNQFKSTDKGDLEQLAADSYFQGWTDANSIAKNK